MKKIDSQALDVLQKALGLSGPGSPITELTDGVVDQVLEVGGVIRRSRTQAGTEGIHAAVQGDKAGIIAVLTVPIQLGLANYGFRGCGMRVGFNARIIKGNTGTGSQYQ